MSDHSKIEWTDASWNPVRAKRDSKVGWYCEHVSEGCRNCYAEGINRRLGTGLDYKPGLRPNVFVSEHILVQPLKWKRPRMIFVCSMSDLFGHWVTDEMLDRIFDVMSRARWHKFQVLTKRPERMREAVKRHLAKTDRPPCPHVWYGVSCEDQETADDRIPILLDTPAAVRFVSAEPLLGPISFRWALWQPWKEHGVTNHLDGLRRLDWLIVGGESGPGARPMHPAWARELRDQCNEAGVAFFYKQTGEWVPGTWPMGSPYQRQFVEHRADDSIHQQMMTKVGKKKAGRLLDGREWNEFPV